MEMSEASRRPVRIEKLMRPRFTRSKTRANQLSFSSYNMLLQAISRNGPEILTPANAIAKPKDSKSDELNSLFEMMPSYR